MSYSFSVQAGTVAELGVKIHEELGKVATAQPIHTELDLVHEQAKQLIARLREVKEGEQLYATVSGSVWQQTAVEGFESCGANVSVGISRAAQA